jgi:cytochrome b561
VARYTSVSIVLHWLLGLAIFGIFAVGVFMADLPVSPLRLKLYNWHKWAGVMFLALSVLRLLWRISHRPPACRKPSHRPCPRGKCASTTPPCI